MPKSTKYTQDEFIEIVKSSKSIRECLIKMGLKHTGGNYKTFYTKVKNLNLDTTHFTGQSHMTGKNNIWNHKRSLSDILKCGVDYQSHRLKLRLISEGMKENKCEICKNSIWMGKNIPLELDHINGVHNDNRIENLRILCPNCHAQTSTYCSKNMKNKIKISAEQKRINNNIRRKKCICKTCGNPCTKSKTGICEKCRYENMPKKFEINREILENDVACMSLIQVGKKYGVSDNAVRKRCIKLGIPFRKETI